MQTDKRRRDLGAVAIMPARVSSMAQILVCRLLVYCQQVETTQGSSTKKTRRKRSLRISFFDKFKVILHSVFNGIAILPTTRITNQFIHNETRHTSTLSVGMDRDRILPALFERIPVSPHIHSRRDQVLLMSCRRQPQGGTPHFRSVPRHR